MSRYFIYNKLLVISVNKELAASRGIKTAVYENIFVSDLYYDNSFYELVSGKIYIYQDKLYLYYREIFDKDVYSRDLSVVADKYYITADYSAKQQFRTFYLVNLKTRKIIREILSI